MPDQQKPNGLLAAGVAASGLLLAALGRGRVRDPAPARSGRPRPGGRDGLGRDAASPTEIPPAGWWEILKRTGAEINDDRVLTEAAGVTFYSLLALFPGIGTLIAVYGLFAEPADIQRHLDLAAGFIPGGGLEIIGEQVKRISEKPGGTLGIGAAIGLATSLWSANAATKALVDALNIVYDERETRSFLRRLLVTMAFTLGAILFVLLAITAVVVLPAVVAVVGLDGLETVLKLVRWPVMLAAIALFLALIYRYGPDRQTAKWRWVSWGSAVASVVWVIGSILFSWYVANFGNYNETYGSLGAAIGFMTWIWLSATVVLAGAELDAEMEHQTARDTTTGPERPLGARGATMADRVAP